MIPVLQELGRPPPEPHSGRKFDLLSGDLAQEYLPACFDWLLVPVGSLKLSDCSVLNPTFESSLTGSDDEKINQIRIC